MPDQSDSHKHGRYVWRDGIRFELIDVADAIEFLRDAGEEAAATNAFWRTVSDWLDVRHLAQRVLEGSGQSQVMNGGEESARRADVFPLDAVMPIFLLHPQHVQNWWEELNPEVIARLRPFPPPKFLIDAEERIRESPFFLTPSQWRDFRAGSPVLVVACGFAFREKLSKGGRNKDRLETALRVALALEAFTQEAVIASLERAEIIHNRKTPDLTKLDGIPVLAELAWAEGAPIKGRCVAPEAPATADERMEFFRSLWDEGRKVALSRAPNSTKENGLRKTIIDSVSRDARDLPPEKIGPVMEAVAGRVMLLLRAWLHATECARTRIEASKRRQQILEPDARRTRPFDPNSIDPMTKRDHAVLTERKFSAGELAQVAFYSDIDPSELCPCHALAWPEFVAARQLGQLARGGDPQLSVDERNVMREILFDPDASALSMYADVRALIREHALSLRPIEDWHRAFRDARR
jgi:hypothetical protein